MKKRPWPAKENPLVAITYELMEGFDQGGNPIYKQGLIESDKELETVQKILEPLEPHPAMITSVTMGKVNLKLMSGDEITLRPVFHPSLETYADLFKVENLDFEMPALLSDLLNRWRSSISGA
ncbi:MAG: hypothetical protein PVF97_00100 [Desulfobacterales bacterium]|jgi:hypothetical protein